MYLKFIRFLTGICLLTSFWPVLRVFNLSIFDLLAPAVIISTLPYNPKNKNGSFKAFQLATIGTTILLCSGIISWSSSADPTDHIEKVIKIFIALSAMIGLAYTITNRKILSIVESLTVLCISSAISSFVCMLQGEFNILINLIPEITNIEEWSRMTGLAEHPIEAGYISVFGVTISIGLAIHTRQWSLYLILGLIEAYSLKYSASLTAFFALIGSFSTVCLYMRKFKFFAAVITLVLLSSTVISVNGSTDKLWSRIEMLTENTKDYETLQYRENQLNKTVQGITLGTIFIGNGYSELDLPDYMEIHNGFIASLYHFGFLGVISQIILISFFCIQMKSNSPFAIKAILLASILTFIAAYMTGPPFSRRSLWITPLMLSAYMTSSYRSHYFTR